MPAVDRVLTAVRKNHGAGAAKSTRSVLSGILGEAVRRGALNTDPARETSPRRTSPRPNQGPRALTINEAHQLRARLAADPEATRLDLPDLVDFHARHRRAHRRGVRTPLVARRPGCRMDHLVRYVDRQPIRHDLVVVRACRSRR